MGKYMLVFDHGTTGIKTCLMDSAGAIVARGYEKITQHYPQPGWVEHNPDELWEKTLTTAQAAFVEAGATWADVTAIGITNQRETVVLWDRQTGRPVHSAIVWQDRRTAERCHALRAEGRSEAILQKTGLVVDPYFSASKIEWLLEKVPATKALLQENRLLFGTVDTWILWKLSGGQVHATDYTNASRTMLFNIHDLQWDGDLLCLFGVPRGILPAVQPSRSDFGASDPALTGGRAIPVTGILGDQQAALYGQKCWRPGQAKSTYGTGAFLMMNTGATPVASRRGLLCTLAADAAGQPCFALEGAIFTAGATVEWLQNKLGVLSGPQEIDPLCESLPDNEGVYLVPAFAGLAAPYWDAEARGQITGLTQDSGKAHLVRAAVEAMAYQTREVLEAMQTESGLSLQALRVDGGVTRSRFLLSFLADTLGTDVLKTDDPELTAKGVGYLAGLGAGFWPSPDAIGALAEALEAVQPNMPEAERKTHFAGWLEAVAKALSKAKAVV